MQSSRSAYGVRVNLLRDKGSVRGCFEINLLPAGN